MQHDAAQQDKTFEVTVLVDGIPRREALHANAKVKNVVKQLLPPADKPDADKYQLTDAQLGPQELPPEQTLAECGVADGHVLAITKRDGGGGER